MKQRKTEHPILMCSKMVRAILAGKKTETRRMAGLKELNEYPDIWNIVSPVDGFITLENDVYGLEQPKHPYGVAGDTLWVRETFALTQFNEPVYRADAMDKKGYRWHSIAAGDPEHEVEWEPSLFMPRWASRITLTVKSVTLERLHEITDEGAKAEGVSDRAEYERLWKQLNGEESWNLNPLVWVVKFEVKEVRK
jgi:hypothetical protein